MCGKFFLSRVALWCLFVDCHALIQPASSRSPTAPAPPPVPNSDEGRPVWEVCLGTQRCPHLGGPVRRRVLAVGYAVRPAVARGSTNADVIPPPPPRAAAPVGWCCWFVCALWLSLLSSSAPQMIADGFSASTNTVWAGAVGLCLLVGSPFSHPLSRTHDPILCPPLWALRASSRLW